MASEENALMKATSGENMREKRERELIIKMDKLMAKITNQETRIHIKKNQAFKSKLLELILYKDQSLKTSALSLMDQLHSQNKNIGDIISLV